MSKRWENVTDKIVANSFLLGLKNYCHKRQISVGDLLIGTTLTPDDFDKGRGFMGLQSYKQIVLNAIRLTDNPNLAFAVARYEHEDNDTGPIGLKTLSKGNLKSAIRTVLRFYRTRCGLFTLTLQEYQEHVQINLEPTVALGDTEHFSITLMIAHLYLIKQKLAPGLTPIADVFFTYSAPEHMADYDELFTTRIKFDAAQSALNFPRNQLLQSQTPIISPMTDHIMQPSHKPSIINAIEKVWATCNRLPNAQAMAEKLLISERTLRRKLAAHHAGYQEILDQYRTKVAKQYLRENLQMPISKIAFYLGFDDASNFSKAFKRWTGQTPKGYRNSH